MVLHLARVAHPAAGDGSLRRAVLLGLGMGPLVALHRTDRHHTGKWTWRSMTLGLWLNFQLQTCLAENSERGLVKESKCNAAHKFRTSL